MGFFKDLFRKQAPAESYDPAKWKPVIRSSICTGEKVAGFIELETRHFRDIMLLQSEDDLKEFRKRYGIEGEIETIY